LILFTVIVLVFFVFCCPSMDEPPLSKTIAPFLYYKVFDFVIECFLRNGQSPIFLGDIFPTEYSYSMCLQVFDIVSDICQQFRESFDPSQLHHMTIIRNYDLLLLNCPLPRVYTGTITTILLNRELEIYYQLSYFMQTDDVRKGHMALSLEICISAFIVGCPTHFLHFDFVDMFHFLLARLQKEFNVVYVVVHVDKEVTNNQISLNKQDTRSLKTNLQKQFVDFPTFTLMFT
jgi:hypothetical protein